MTDQYVEHTITMMRSLARGEHPYGTGPFDADHIKLFATDAHRLLGRLDDVVEAANVLFTNRHSLPPDVLRTLACVWQCASAARYGEPHEEFWADQDDFYASHDDDACEDENQAGAA